ncbi:MAG: cobalamin-dependent protein [Spirochaetia bacterium]|jgi:anaerobic magnesium-protoporphyrin IX monomethyl ester cyclase|nr:cobalamin-dependent protein [Spirochaetia bacterium]
MNDTEHLLEISQASLLNIILVQPPVEDFYFTPHRSSTLGLHSLSEIWRTRGHHCQVINCALEKPLKKQIKIPETLTYLNPYRIKYSKDIKSTSWFNNYYRFGSSIENCVKQIIEFNPDVVAVSCFAWGYAESSLKLLEKLKEIRRTKSLSFLLVVGGPGVTVMPEYFSPFADLVVTGEGEDSIIEIENMAGLAEYSYPGKIINPGFTGELPFVYNLKSRRNSRFTVSTIISRGCPKMCSFCANHLVFGRKLRKVPLSDLKKGMNVLFNEVLTRADKEEKIKLHMNFEDDNILFYKEYFLEILNYINK